MPDPYARVTFSNASASTRRIEKTLCPVWDETIIFENISLAEDPQCLTQSPPDIVVEVFDYDKLVCLSFSTIEMNYFHCQSCQTQKNVC